MALSPVKLLLIIKILTNTFHMMLRLLSIVFLFMGSSADKIPLLFSYITTLTGDFVASGAIPIVDKALHQINSRDDILQNYTLNYTTILDSECKSSPAINAFLHHFKNASQPTYITSLCCGCSTATIPVAEISHHWNIPQVAFAAAATTLNDRERFKYFFRALPSLSFNSFTYAQIMREFGWTQTAIITQQEQLFTKVVHSLEVLYAEEGWKLQEIPIESNFDYDTVLNEIVADNHKIVILNCYGEQAIAVLCEAHHRGMRYPEYVFFPLGGLGEEWWESYPETISPCSHSVIAEMVIGSLSIVPEGFFLNQDTSGNTTSGQSIEKFRDEYLKLLSQPEYSQYSELGVAGVAFDSIWSIAIGLDIAARKIAIGNDSGCSHLPGALVPLEQFDYDNQRLGCIMKQSMDEVTFTGVTREFKYIDGHAADNIILLNQERENEQGRIRSKVVAKIDNTENASVCKFLDGESIDTIWENGVPYDGAPVKTLIRNSLALQVIYYVLACCGLCFATVCAVFNITFHRKKTVKLASPNLNYIILIGSTLLYSCAILYAYSVHSFDDAPTFTVICNIRFWVFSLGYTSCFAVILSKQWRIYYILNNPTAKKKTIKDRFLVIIIAVVIAIDTLIVMVDTVIPETRPLAKLVPYFSKYSTSEDTEMLQENYIFTCSNKSIHISLLASFIYKALLQVVGVFMAFHTRKIKIRVLNDSKEITAIIYINSIILVSLVITEFGLRAYNDAYAAVFGLALLIEATLFIGIVFIPKMVNLYLDPHGRTIFSSSTPQQQNSPTGQMKYEKNDAAGSNDDNHDTVHDPEEKSDKNTKSKENTSSARASSLDEVMEIGLP